MKCLKCHAEIDETSKFCTVCGTKVPDWKKLKTLTIKLAGIAVIIIVALIAVVSNVNGPDKVIKKYVRAIETSNGKLMYKVYAPEYNEYLIGPGSFYSDKDELIDDYTEECKDDYEELLGNNTKPQKIKYEIIKKEKLDKDELHDLNACLEDQLDFKRNSASAAYNVTFICYMPGSDDVYTLERYIFKIRGKWYMGRGFIL